MAYLDDHPPVLNQGRARNVDPSGVIVVHTFEFPTDLTLPDLGAETGARAIANRTDRSASYHAVGDSDSVVELWNPFTTRAYHDATGTNSHSVGVSFMTYTDAWADLLRDHPWWVEDALKTMALYLADLIKRFRDEFDIDIPVKRISAYEAYSRVPGFIAHADLDPDRRTDPGVNFPWSTLFMWINYYLYLEEDMVPRAVKAPNDNATYCPDPWVPITSQRDREQLIAAKLITPEPPVTLDAGLFDRVRRVGVVQSPSSASVGELLAVFNSVLDDLPDDIAAEVVDELKRRL